MPRFELRSVETDDVIEIPTNDTVTLGRGSFLRCNAIGVSKYHATLKPNDNEDSVRITSTNNRPLYYKLKPTESENIFILSKNESVSLEDGHSFGLMLDRFWYRICRIENPASRNSSRDKVKTAAVQSVEQSGGNTRPSVAVDDNVMVTHFHNVGNDLNPGAERNIIYDLLDVSRSPKDITDTVGHSFSEDRLSTTKPALKRVCDPTSGKRWEKRLKLTVRPMESVDISPILDDDAEDCCEPRQCVVDSPLCVGRVKTRKITTVNSVPPIPKQGKFKKRFPCELGVDCQDGKPAHLLNFAHPGDLDYEENPESGDIPDPDIFPDVPRRPGAGTKNPNFFESKLDCGPIVPERRTGRKRGPIHAIRFISHDNLHETSSWDLQRRKKSKQKQRMQRRSIRSASLISAGSLGSEVSMHRSDFEEINSDEDV